MELVFAGCADGGEPVCRLFRQYTAGPSPQPVNAAVSAGSAASADPSESGVDSNVTAAITIFTNRADMSDVLDGYADDFKKEVTAAKSEHN